MGSAGQGWLETAAFEWLWNADYCREGQGWCRSTTDLYTPAAPARRARDCLEPPAPPRWPPPLSLGAVGDGSTWLPREVRPCNKDAGGPNGVHSDERVCPLYRSTDMLVYGI